MFYGEQRESEDIDFLCDPERFGVFRSLVKEIGIATIFPGAQSEIRADRYGIRGRVDGIKLEIVLEARIPLAGNKHESGILTLSPECLMAEKLLANSDRGADAAALHKDIIDLAILYNKFPESFILAYGMAYGAYKDSIPHDFSSALNRFSKQEIRRDIAEKFKIEPGALSRLMHSMINMRKELEGFVLAKKQERGQYTRKH